jgi:hypothetical protein
MRRHRKAEGLQRLKELLDCLHLGVAGLLLLLIARLQRLTTGRRLTNGLEALRLTIRRSYRLRVAQVEWLVWSGPGCRMVTTDEVIGQRRPATAVGAEGSGPGTIPSAVVGAMSTREGHSRRTGSERGEEGSGVAESRVDERRESQ